MRNPEFARVILQLLEAKGLDPEDPDTIQLMELFQNDPKSIEKFGLNFLPEAPAEEMDEEQQQQQQQHIDPELQHTLAQDETMFEGFDDTHVAALAGHAELAPMVPPDQIFDINETTMILPQPVSMPAPIPKLDVKIEEVDPAPIVPVQPLRRTIIAPPAYIPPPIPPHTRPLASKDRIRAMGFPPAISPPPR